MLHRSILTGVFVNFMVLCVLSLQPANARPVASSIDNIRVVKISPKDQTAVIKTAKQEMTVVHVGDCLVKGGRVTMIAADKIVVEHHGQGKVETIIIRFNDGKQIIDRITQIPDTTDRLIEVQQSN